MVSDKSELYENESVTEILNNKKLGFGSLRLPRISDSTSIDYDMLDSMVDAFIDAGYRYFEVGYAYANEEIFRRCLVKRHKRDSFLLANKLPLRSVISKKQCYEVFNESLKKSGVEFFDFYMLHCVTLKLYKPIEGFCFDFLVELKQKRLANKVGFSFHDNADVLEEILSKHHTQVDFVQLQINYLDWDSPVIQSKQCYEVARKYGLPIFVMVPAKGGILATLSPEAMEVISSVSHSCTSISWAYRFAASLEGVEIVLTGMDNMKQTNENIATMRDFLPFSDEEYEAIPRVIKIIQEGMKIQCTLCGYCLPECPRQIPIPPLFAWYNNYRPDSLPNYYYYYQRICEGKGTPNDCTKCKLCETVCPQQISIHEYIGVISGIYKGDIYSRLEPVIMFLRKIGLINIVYKAAKWMQGKIIGR